MNLTEFLLARIRDDQADAMVGWRWKALPAGEYTRLQARVLAECSAKRRIVDLGICTACAVEGQPCNHQDETLRLLAVPYADHPAYDQAWRP